MTKEKVISAIKEIDEEIKRLENNKRFNKRILVDDFCPYKVGQKAKYVRIQTKRTGGIFNPKREKVGEREEILVCVLIEVCDWDYNDFRYNFRRLKADGTLTQNLVHVSRDDIEWLDEYYEAPKL